MHNVILIGMPGVGKSTLGVLLAKTLGMTFLDTDLVIQDQKRPCSGADRPARHRRLSGPGGHRLRRPPGGKRRDRHRRQRGL
ncbi:MAG: shikimate kinase [Evtepia gabavorous]